MLWACEICGHELVLVYYTTFQRYECPDHPPVETYTSDSTGRLSPKPQKPA